MFAKSFYKKKKLYQILSSFFFVCIICLFKLQTSLPSIENCLLSGQAEVLVGTVSEHEEVMLVEVVQPGHGPHLQLGEVELGQLPRAAAAAHMGH